MERSGENEFAEENDICKNVEKCKKKLNNIEERVGFILDHIDKLHDTNIDLACQFMNSENNNEKKKIEVNKLYSFLQSRE